MRSPEFESLSPERSFVIEDRIYGIVEITSPAMKELVNSRQLQRLKGVAQYGVPDEFYHLENYYRFEHCVGVMILLKKLGASEEEQIAGLLHDVSHTAFSHVIDWVITDGRTEDFQDTQHKDHVINSEIADILKRNGYDPERISRHEGFRLLERELPDLCADRIDYALREFPPEVIQQCLNGLTVKEGKIVFKDKNSAYLFAKYFLQKQMSHWAGFEAMSRYRLFANVLRKALETQAINFDDFWQDDAFIVSKLKSTPDSEIQRILAVLRNKSLEGFPKSGEVWFKKFRYVDPEFIHDSRLVRLSEVDEEFKQDLQEAQEKNSNGIAIALV